MLSRYSALIKDDSKVSGLKNKLGPGGPHLKFHLPTESLRYNAKSLRPSLLQFCYLLRGTIASYYSLKAQEFLHITEALHIYSEKNAEG